MIYSKRLFLSIIAVFLIVTTVSAEDKWELLHKGTGGDRDVYYNPESIKKIDENIHEIFIAIIFAENKNSVQKIRIDCKNKKTAIGMSVVNINDVEVQKMDFSKNGWVWSDHKNSVDKKLLNLVCKKK